METKEVRSKAHGEDMNVASVRSLQVLGVRGSSASPESISGYCCLDAILMHLPI